MQIQVLPQDIVNQIAAGEVIERPASVIKELMENAIDAEATEITVKIIDAGKNFISVSDNGIGMDADSLQKCVLSHATSKLNRENLFNIHTFGFRGEALPSIASIARLSISSTKNDSEGWCIKLEGSQNLGLSPVNMGTGTTVEVRDLFFATPARLKFLKSDSYEADSCFSVFNRIALSNNNVSFKFIENDKEKAYYRATDNLMGRVRDVFGESFIKNVFEINAKRAEMHLHGYIGVPTFNKSSGSSQYFFVNNRFVKDKIFTYALKSAYSSLTPRGRYPVAILFINLPYNEVDVNAHPAKTEIRFRESDKVRMFVVSELKTSLTSFGSSVATTELTDNFYAKAALQADERALSEKSVESVRSSTFLSSSRSSPLPSSSSEYAFQKDRFPEKKHSICNDDVLQGSYNPTPQPKCEVFEPNLDTIMQSAAVNDSATAEQLQSAFPLKGEEDAKPGAINLGRALFQIQNMYVVSECEDGLIIVDQHAAAERMMIETLRNDLKLKAQDLLIPDICGFSESEVELLKANEELLRKLGINIEIMSKDLVSINSLPAILESSDAKPIITDIVDELSMFGSVYSIEEKVYSILSSMSCHSSIRAGKKLSLDEMNHLLKRMEQTTNIAQCCHGRPSYIKISVKDLNKFFERT